MTYKYILAAGIFTLLLAACGKADVESACFSNADHEKLSDSRITRICGCVVKRVTAANLTEAETEWVITMLENNKVKDVPPDKYARFLEVSKLFVNVKNGCEAVK